jgi:hypothetical protein
MKTRIITLESHDDLISVRDRMSWAKTPRILLVWPRYEKVNLRQVDLKVLQRHAASLGAQLGLVTRARRVRADAEALQIPVFQSTGQAQRVPWPKPRRAHARWVHRAPRKDLREQREQVRVREAAWRTHPVTSIVAFLVGVLSVLVLVALFIPRAEVRLHPESQRQSIILPVTASRSAKSVFITGTIPAYEKRLVLDGTHSVAVTGEAVAPQSKAQGEVVFRNLTQQAVTIPAGTILRTVDNIRFVTTRRGVLEAGVDETIVLPIEAVEGGRAGNVEAESIVIVEGGLGTSVVITNPEPTSGGRQVPSVQASERDRQRARDELMDMLADEARLQFESEAGPGDILFEDTFAVTQILLEEFDPPPGATGTRLTLELQVEFSILYASQADLDQLATLALNASIPVGFIPASTDVSITTVTEPVSNSSGTARWRVRVERQLIRQIDQRQITHMIQGIPSQRAQLLLQQNLPLDGAPQITLAPTWWPWVPIVPFRISVITEL